MATQLLADALVARLGGSEIAFSAAITACERSVRLSAKKKSGKRDVVE